MNLLLLAYFYAKGICKLSTTQTCQGTTQNGGQDQLATLLSQFAGFLVDAKFSQAILISFMTALEIGNLSMIYRLLILMSLIICLLN